MIIHKVKDGEQIDELSLIYNTPKNLILSYNKIEEIRNGDYIIIPKFCGTVYKVQPFDTIDKISQKFNISADEILIKNKITQIFPFMEIVI